MRSITWQGLGREIRDLDNVRCIKDENVKILVKEAKTKERWQNYFYKCFNGELIENSQRKELGYYGSQPNYHFCNTIREDEIKETLRKMPNEKVVGPSQIIVEVRNGLG